MTRRPAFTLAELVVAITAGSVLLTLAIGTVHRSMSIHRRGEHRDRAQAVAARLSREFRRDVRRATGAHWDGETLTLTSPASDSSLPIAYELVDRGVVRRQARPDGGERRETYAFDPKATVTLTELAERSQVRLEVAAATPLGDGRTRLLTVVEATLGAGVIAP